MYYGIRNLVVVPAGIAGGALWQLEPALPLEVAFVVGAIGTAVFLLTSRGQSDGSTAGRPRGYAGEEP